MSADRRSGSGRLAGWLFADILLVLALLGFSELEPGTSVKVSTTTSAPTTSLGPSDESVPSTSTTAPSPTTTAPPPTTSESPRICAALGSEEQIFRVSVASNVDDARLVESFENQVRLHLAALGLEPNTPVGFALAFGGPDLVSGPGRAANTMNRLVRLNAARLDRTVFRAYGDTSLDSSRVVIDVFPLVSVIC